MSRTTSSAATVARGDTTAGRSADEPNRPRHGRGIGVRPIGLVALLAATNCGTRQPTPADDGNASTATTGDDGADECPSRVLYGDFEIGTQAQLDAVAGVTELEGTMRIGGDWIPEGEKGFDTLDITPLSCLREVRGKLEISWGQAIIDATNIEALSKLELVQGDLDLNEFHSLPDLSGLRSLRQVTGIFHVTEAHSLVNFTGLDSLEDVGVLWFSGNDGIRNFKGLPKLRRANEIVLRYLSGLESAEGFPALEESEYLWLHGGGLTPLTTFEGLKQHDWREISLQAFPNVQTLAGFNLNRARSLAISVLGITDLTGLQPMTEFPILPGEPGGIHINGCNKLKSLSGLEQLRRVDGALWLSALESLESLDALANLEEVTTVLQLEKLTLVDIDELDPNNGSALKKINELRFFYFYDVPPCYADNLAADWQSRGLIDTYVIGIGMPACP